MLVFWQKGFDDTSIQDLVSATGLNRGSLYNAFGDKAQLFAQVMERYRSQSPARQLAEALEAESPRRLIVEFLETLVARAKTDPDHKGCLITNTAAGLYGCDETMMIWIRETMGRLEDALCQAVERGQNLGEITPATSARSLARFLVATAQGINVMARANPNEQILRDVMTHAISALGDPADFSASRRSEPALDVAPFTNNPRKLY